MQKKKLTIKNQFEIRKINDTSNLAVAPKFLKSRGQSHNIKKNEMFEPTEHIRAFFIAKNRPRTRITDQRMRMPSIRVSSGYRQHPKS